MNEQDAVKHSPHLHDEADVGSGEKSPGQQDTDAMVNQIGTAPKPAEGRPLPPAPGIDKAGEAIEGAAPP